MGSSRCGLKPFPRLHHRCPRHPCLVATLPSRGHPGLCSVPRGRWDLSKRKSDPVSPSLLISRGNYNALPWSPRALHEPALAHQPFPLLSSLCQPHPGSLFSGLSPNVTLFDPPPTKVAPTPAPCQIPLLCHHQERRRLWLSCPLLSLREP